MAKKTKTDLVTCPLCGGRGEMNKHQAVVRLRDPEFRETILGYQDDVLDPERIADPFETRQAEGKNKTPTDSVLAHRSWKE